MYSHLPNIKTIETGTHDMAIEPTMTAIYLDSGKVLLIEEMDEGRLFTSVFQDAVTYATWKADRSVETMHDTTIKAVEVEGNQSLYSTIK